MSELQDSTDRTTRPVTALTARQTEMLVCLANGMTAKECAAHLGIAYDTVRRHLQDAYARLGVQTATSQHSAREAFLVLGWLNPPKL